VIATLFYLSDILKSIMLFEERTDDEPVNKDPASSLHFVTQDTRGNIIQDILGHPRLSPSFKEINYLNPSKSEATLREHIDRLEERGFVEQVELRPEDRTRDLPYKFYTLTEPGATFLNDHGLFIEELRDIRSDFQDVERPPHIRKIQEAPRPDIVDNRCQLVENLAIS
jgi:DNA-binding PadR family transcriptional regulator